MIRDAMHQVWDFFELLHDESDERLAWELTDAKFNSPFVVEGKAVNTRTGRDAYEAIEPMIRDVAGIIGNISSEQPANISPKKRKKITRLLERNINGIEKTTYDFGYEIAPVVIDHDVAELGLKLLDQPSELDGLVSTFAHEEYGSIMGSLSQLGRYRRKPAINVKDFNTGEKIWCQVDQPTLAELESKIVAKDVWEQRDIMVQGMLDYDSQGKLTYIKDGIVSYLDRRKVSVDELHDPDFSDGLPSEEYLEQLRAE